MLPLIEFLSQKFKEFRGIPLTITELTESYFGKVKNKNDYKEIWDFNRNKLRIAHGIRKLRQLTGLHIYSCFGKGYVVLEKQEDFDYAITKQVKTIERHRLLMVLLQKDLNNPNYKKRLNAFFGNNKMTPEEFNHMAKIKLRRNIIKKKKIYHKRY